MLIDPFGDGEDGVVVFNDVVYVTRGIVGVASVVLGKSS